MVELHKHQEFQEQKKAETNLTKWAILLVPIKLKEWSL